MAETISEDSPIGNLIIVAAPSGGGKTSLVKALVTNTPGVEVSISHTTRVMRPGEAHGVDYFFISKEEFETMIEAKAFIEYACVFNHHYGTSIQQIESRLYSGVDVVLDIDWQGAEQIKRLFPEAISIFILPPSLSTLKERLEKRQQDNHQIIGDRMMRAQHELSHYEDFDYLVLNDRFEDAAADLQTIVLANRLRCNRQKIKHAELLSILLT